MKKILIIAMAESIHTARWIVQINDQKWDFFLFPSYDGRGIHPRLKNLKITYPHFLDNKVFQKTLVFKLFQKLKIDFKKKYFPKYYERKLLKFINKIKPDLIHTLETQGAGYLMLNVFPHLKRRIPWWHTNWGSDIFVFGNLEKHKLKIQSILENCDFYSCECNRDVQLGKDFGFKGKVFSVIPNTGGFGIDNIATLRSQFLITSKRKSIILKGYQGWAGRALVAIRALERCADLLSGYTLFVFSNTSSQEIIISTSLLSKNTGLKVVLIPERSDHDEILKFQAQSRIYIGLSIGDGISTSLLESMAMGSFPIQSCTACANEWIQDGVTGFVVPPEDPEIIEKALRIALLDDKLVDSAFVENFRTIREKADSNVLKEITISSYKSILGQL
jgi:glycosyltransferase involved in cell wall biosynthesis